ncbi:ferredoxin reductase family protein [Glaciibacter psychrotolerans]|uniref:Putative ferric reductase n=1 Tax=Glaciibacter psychrotolerans TaxID=670054 RepID=A0A7Z0J6V1_9MICO|nr:ferric reductase-like transmembrane domain-containing protein [Leifsonia psychrotolerans]NYJ20571.1 putative ferric reductase [Leifsonia psychrotolerans]
MTRIASPARSGGAPVLARARRTQLRRRLRAADLIVIAGWSSVAAAVALYLSSGGLASVVTLSSALSALGIVTGLVGTDFILLMLLLAARLPFIDRAVGQDVAMRWHRALGKPALYLILAHLVLLTIGYAVADQVNVIAETVLLFTTPDMAIAYLGFGLLLVVVVSSVVAVRRRFPYEVWHAIHLLSYLAVLVALPHQLSTGAVLSHGTAQRWYWIALYVLTFASVAWFRFTVPLIRSIRHGLRVESVQPVAPGVVSIHLRGRDLDRLNTAGGQYAIWRFWSHGVWWHAHPISFSAIPTASTARVTVRQLGRGSGQLARLSPGTRVTIEGPYGLFTDRARTSPRLAIVAAGIGITPVRTLLEHSSLRAGEATVLLRGTDESQGYLWDEVVALGQSARATVYSMIGRRPAGVDTWMSAEAIARGVTLASIFPDLASSDLYVCGPPAWTDLVVRDARTAGIPDLQIHVERFDW